MIELTERQKEALIISMAMKEVPDSNTERVWFTEGFEAALDYSHKEIEELKAKIERLERNWNEEIRRRTDDIDEAGAMFTQHQEMKAAMNR